MGAARRRKDKPSAGAPVDPATLRVAERGELPTAQLVEMAADYNPRQISDAEFEALRKSIRFFGFVEPLVVNRRSNRIVGGHQRLRAAVAEGYATLPVMFVELDPPSEMQLNVALNRISGEWDDAKLAEILSTLSEQGADVKLTGFTDDEIAAILLNGDDFKPSDEDAARLDKTGAFIRCPECGHEFESPTSFRKVIARDPEQASD